MGSPAVPDPEPKLTMEPPPASRSAGYAACISSRVARGPISETRAKSSNERSMNRLGSLLAIALFTSPLELRRDGRGR